MLIVLWMVNAVSLLIVGYLLRGITLTGFWAAMLAALVLGLLTALIKPILILLTLPITVVTMGLFLLVVNALVFWLAGSILKGFEVNGFWWALIGAIVYSVLSTLFSSLLYQA